LYDPRFSVLHFGRHASSSGKGILRSLLFNQAARYHFFSWVKYCIKWRRDILEKALFLIHSRMQLTRRPKSKMGYSMDFSTYYLYSFNSHSDLS
jgi:hypothetical protein